MLESVILPEDIYARLLLYASVIVALLQAVKMGLARAGVIIKGRWAVALNMALTFGMVLLAARPVNGSQLWQTILQAFAAGGMFTMGRSLMTNQPTQALPPASTPAEIAEAQPNGEKVATVTP